MSEKNRVKIALDGGELVSILKEREALRERVAGLEAARTAYASEFAPDKDGNPDVGSIHQNIRELKNRLQEASQ